MSDEDITLTPIEVKAVDFCGDEITGALVRVEGADRVYRRECFRVLWKAFRPDILPTSELAPQRSEWCTAGL